MSQASASKLWKVGDIASAAAQRALRVRGKGFRLIGFGNAGYV